MLYVYMHHIVNIITTTIYIVHKTYVFCELENYKEKKFQYLIGAIQLLQALH